MIEVFRLFYTDLLYTYLFYTYLLYTYLLYTAQMPCCYDVNYFLTVWSTHLEAFDLDPRLDADTLPLADLPLCRALLMNDARYPWVILVPRVTSVSEVFELSPQDQTQLWREASLLGEAMHTTFSGDKLNIATLGNVVSQLHIHLVVRSHDDASWPGPVWGNGSAVPYSLNQQGKRREQLIAQIEGLALD